MAFTWELPPSVAPRGYRIPNLNSDESLAFSGRRIIVTGVVCLRFSSGRWLKSNIGGPVSLSVRIFGVAAGLSIVLKMLDEELPGVGGILSGTSVSSAVSVEHRTKLKETYRDGIRSEMSCEPSPPASIRKTEKPSTAKLALCSG
jgi:hypothetical protein